MIHIISMCIGPIILVLSGKEDGLCDEGMDGGVAKNVVQQRYTAIPPPFTPLPADADSCCEVSEKERLIWGGARE